MYVCMHVYIYNYNYIYIYIFLPNIIKNIYYLCMYMRDFVSHKKSLSAWENKVVEC